MVGSIERFVRACLSSRLGLVTTLVVAIVGTTTIGFAAATTAGVIYACVNNSSGTLKIVGAGETCPANWPALSWSAEGSAGLTGATGATGPASTAGATGGTAAARADGAGGTRRASEARAQR